MTPRTSRKDNWNRCRFVRGDAGGHYESYFQRANHPDQPLAFWIRYTIFSPKGCPDSAVGELWAIWFDGLNDRIVAAKQVVPIAECAFSDAALGARIGSATLDNKALSGAAASGDHTIEWALGYQGNEPPLLLFPEAYYARSFPKAKVLVGTPHAVYDGTLVVDGETISVDGWVGSQNHNWGSKHTDHYAWGQVAGFEGVPEAFLECSTARVKLGPIWSPWLTLIVLRIDGREHALNTLWRGARASGRFDYFTWGFDSRDKDVRIHGRIEAPRSRFVALRYDNPPGGWKTCLNSKLAACSVTLERRGEPARTLRTEHRAAFEILTDDRDHGVPFLA
ncbi:MAG: hypothetical protein JXQ73_28935 [Phycisphaerae bacterium]|nr:hypothetical protein [Phycisphaerae bacterium]